MEGRDKWYAKSAMLYTFASRTSRPCVSWLGWAWLCSPVVLREPPSKRKSSGHRRCHGAWGGRTTHQEKLRMSLVNVKLGVEKQVQVNKGKRPRKPNTPKGEFDQRKYVQYVIGGRNRNTPSNLQQQGQRQGTETEREARQPQGTFALIWLFREMGLRISWVCFYRGNVQEIRFL